MNCLFKNRKILLLGFFAVLALASVSNASMLTSNILQRVISVRMGGMTATAFTVEVDGRQYLITAKHVVAVSSSSRTIEIFHDDAWVKLPFRLIAVEPNTVDIVALAFDQQLTPLLPIQTGIKGAYLSQEVFFAGFPLGLSINGHKLNSGFPLPLVKHGIISSFENNRGEPFLVDAINNPGFSGGPVVCSDNSSNPTIIGVVSGYKAAQESVFKEEQTTDLSVYPNTGLLVAYSMDYVIEAIKKSPIGFRVSAP